MRRVLAPLWSLSVLTLLPFDAQQAPQSSAAPETAKPTEKSTEKVPAPEVPAQIELLETRVRFDANGDSRKEVHTRVHINSELGVRQFARLNFDYNRSFESIDIPLVHITHSRGGTADILPSAISDTPNPAVINAPAYQDVRVKSVRILGLAPGDLLEYRVINTISHHPLAPDFWLEHSFDRTGVVSQEIFELDLPAARQVRLRVNPATPATSTEKSGEGNSARVVYRWQPPSQDSKAEPGKKSLSPESDVVLTTTRDWGEFINRIASQFAQSLPVPEIAAKTAELTHSAVTPEEKFRVLYDSVSQEIRTVDLPLGATGFRLRLPMEIISSGYATSEEKCALLSVLARGIKDGPSAAPALIASSGSPQDELPRISAFSRILVAAASGDKHYWLDPSIEVAPFGLVPSNLRGKFALRLYDHSDSDEFDRIDSALPFRASQRVHVDAHLAADGKLSAKVHYSLRGDSELLLRVAFHQAPKEKWKEVAGLLSISDGFGGQVTSVSASDPYATHEPFTVDYEITQPKFVDWSKKPVRIPALLPQLGLPEPPAKLQVGVRASPIELGTPLEVETRATLYLPSPTTVEVPTGTSVKRDYASFSSQYSARGQTITATRHLNFMLLEIPATRASDYDAFLHAVQSDQAQLFTLVGP